MMGAYVLLDLTPKGGHENEVPDTIEWMRREDRFGPQPVAKAPPAAGSCREAHA